VSEHRSCKVNGMKNVLLLGVFLSFNSYGQGSESRASTIKAERIAESSPLLVQHLKEIKNEALKIHDKTLRASVLSLLGTPRFELARRHQDEAQIRKFLMDRKLLASSDVAPHEIIPNHTAMPFIAAPASAWFVHHTYPGGLVMHTLTNLRTSVFLGQNAEHMNHVHVNFDWLRAAPIWHDVAKTLTLEWKPDGSANMSEGTIAGTGAHHILGLAEAMMRELPPDFIVVVASAHSPADTGEALNQLIGFLQAASIISGKPFQAAGLTEDGSALAKPAPLESFLHHLSDHDWVLSEVSFKEAVNALHASFPDLNFWKQDELFSNVGDLRITEAWRSEGTSGVKKLFEK